MKAGRRAYLMLVLHAHLPYVRHPEYPSFLEERWLFEAITECYLPLLDMLERLAGEGVPHRLTLSLSPPLMSMLADPLLQARYRRHLERQMELAKREVEKNKYSQYIQYLAEYYLSYYENARRRYDKRHDGDLLGAFVRLQQAGGIELITSAATHGYLPLLRQVRSAVRGQLRVAGDFFQASTGRQAPGIWLPECGYYQGLENELEQTGYRYFFLETHGVAHADPRPVHGVETPIACGNGLAAFGRDPGCSADVWSAETGYPGHADYRDFHRDIGYERDADYLGALAQEDGTAAPTGIKYHRVTDRMATEKALYDPVAARLQAKKHAGEFIRARIQAAGASRLRDRPPLFVAPYDAELFGHWWFEGPHWLERVIRGVAENDQLDMLTPGDYLERHPLLPLAEPSPSSWGEGGFSRRWLNRQTAWLYPHLHNAATQMAALAADFADAEPDSLESRTLRQAGRSLLLAQASDWPFILRNGGAEDYAQKRVRSHLSRFQYLTQTLNSGNIDSRRLAALEELDNIFPELEYTSLSA